MGRAAAQQTQPDPRSPVYLSIGDDFQSVVNAHPERTYFIVRAGVHREQQVIPKEGDIFIGEPGAVMKGSRVLIGWKPYGIDWVTTLSRDIVPGLKNGQCSNLNPRDQQQGETGVHASVRLGLACTLPEMLFVTDPTDGTVRVLTKGHKPRGPWSREMVF
jgi:hypothetical protein